MYSCTYASQSSVINKKDTSEISVSKDSSVDIDLTQLGDNLAYAEVYRMTEDPDSYIGKTVKISGFL